MRNFLAIIEIVGAILIGVVTYFVRKDATDALLIGFVLLFAIELLRTRIEVDEFSELALIYGLKGFDNISGNTIYVPRDDILAFWKNCVSRTQNHWKVITYSLYDDMMRHGD